MLCARICMRARSSVCAREGGEVHKNREMQKNKEVHKNKNGPKSESRAVFIIRINNLDYCTLLAE